MQAQPTQSNGDHQKTEQQQTLARMWGKRDTAGGRVHGAATLAISMALSYQAKDRTPYNPTIALFGIYPKVSISSSRDTVRPCPQLGTRRGLESENVVHRLRGIFFKRKESEIYERMSRAGKALLTEVISAQQDKHSTSSLVRGA